MLIMRMAFRGYDETEAVRLCAESMSDETLSTRLTRSYENDLLQGGNERKLYSIHVMKI